MPTTRRTLTTRRSTRERRMVGEVDSAGYRVPHPPDVDRDYRMGCERDRAGDRGGAGPALSPCFRIVPSAYAALVSPGPAPPRPTVGRRPTRRQVRSDEPSLCRACSFAAARVVRSGGDRRLIGRSSLHQVALNSDQREGANLRGGLPFDALSAMAWTGRTPAQRRGPEWCLRCPRRGRFRGCSYRPRCRPASAPTPPAPRGRR
jgi:hypothetical protein